MSIPNKIQNEILERQTTQLLINIIKDIECKIEMAKQYLFDNRTIPSIAHYNCFQKLKEIRDLLYKKIGV